MPTKTKRKAEFRLSKTNYYSPDRPHLSVSQIKDYVKGPDFYYRRHVLRDPAVSMRITGPIKRGSIVDDMLTRGGTDIQVRVKKADDPVLFEAQKAMNERLLIEERYWNEAMEIVAFMRTHPAWTENLDKAELQYVLEGEFEGVKICGLADRVEFLEGGRVPLVDLKVVSPVKLDSPRKWLWNVLEMGYDKQMGLYQDMLSKKLGVPKHKIPCLNVVAAYFEPGLVKTATYVYPQALLDRALAETHEIIRSIKAKKFAPLLRTRADAEILPFGLAGDDDFESEEEDED